MIRPALVLAALAAAPAAAAAQARERGIVPMSGDEGERRFQEQWGYADAVVAGHPRAGDYRNQDRRPAPRRRGRPVGRGDSRCGAII